MLLLSRVWLSVTPWTVACQAPLSMGFSRQEDWSEFPCPPPGDLPNPGVELRSPTVQEDSVSTESPEKLNYRVVLIAAVEQSDSVTHTHTCVLFHVLFHYGLLWDIEYSSLCHPLGPCFLSILYVPVCIC